VAPSSSLNTTASPFSPSTSQGGGGGGGGEAGDELTEWLLFSPSSSKGPLSTCGCDRSACPLSPMRMQSIGKGKHRWRRTPTPEEMWLYLTISWLTLGGVSKSCSRTAPPWRWTSSFPPQGSWKVVTRRKQWRKVIRPPPPPQQLQQLRRLVPTDLIGCCFNCLHPDHVAAEFTNASRCLRCRGEGHQARTCKRPHSPDSTGPPPRHQRPAPAIVINPTKGDKVLAAPAPHRAPSHRRLPAAEAKPSHRHACSHSGSGTPPEDTTNSTPNAPPPPSRHTLPSPPPALEPRGDPDDVRASSSISSHAQTRSMRPRRLLPTPLLYWWEGCIHR
jgi:hypothetical protein